MNYKFLDALEVSPVIAAVKDDEGVDACLKSESQVVFYMETSVQFRRLFLK